MLRCGLACFVFYVAIKSIDGVSTKMDFGEEESPSTTNSTGIGDEDVEVKHTIVVSTKLKNNNNFNRRAITSNSQDNAGITYRVGSDRNSKKESDEIPIIPGYRALETTKIRTPDTQLKNKIFPDSTFVNRNIRDELDIYPNVVFNPNQWKPATFFNNINWNYPSLPNPHRTKIFRPGQQNNINNNRKVSDAGIKEFYCRKCAELTNQNIPSPKGCVQQRNNPWVETTTTKMKLDGKLAKLN